MEKILKQEVDEIMKGLLGMVDFVQKWQDEIKQAQQIEPPARVVKNHRTYGLSYIYYHPSKNKWLVKITPVKHGKTLTIAQFDDQVDAENIVVFVNLFVEKLWKHGMEIKKSENRRTI